MSMALDTQQRIERYLGKLQRRLRGVKDKEVRDIVEELRSHIVDKIAASGEGSGAAVDATLAALGTPEELAQQYLADNLLARAEASRSPVQIIENALRWASLNVGGLFVLLGSLTGYFFGLLFMLWAVLKPLHPQTAGLWIGRDSTGDLSISVHVWAGTAAAGSRDVLGWWIVPIGLLAGCGLAMLTTRLVAWYAQQCRRSLVSTRG